MVYPLVGTHVHPKGLYALHFKQKMKQGVLLMRNPVRYGLLEELKGGASGGGVEVGTYFRELIQRDVPPLYHKAKGSHAPKVDHDVTGLLAWMEIGVPTR